MRTLTFNDYGKTQLRRWLKAVLSGRKIRVDHELFEFEFTKVNDELFFKVPEIDYENHINNSSEYHIKKLFVVMDVVIAPIEDSVTKRIYLMNIMAPDPKGYANAIQEIIHQTNLVRIMKPKKSSFTISSKHLD